MSISLSQSGQKNVSPKLFMIGGSMEQCCLLGDWWVCYLCSVHCGTFSSASEQYACGFANSSIHVWPSNAHNLPPTATSGHMTVAQPTGLSDTTHCTLVGHSGPVYSTCFNNDGRFLASGSEDSTVQLWHVESNTNVVSYQGHAYPIWDVTFR